jgi:hypothetical protein
VLVIEQKTGTIYGGTFRFSLKDDRLVSTGTTTAIDGSSITFEFAYVKR